MATALLCIALACQSPDEAAIRNAVVIVVDTLRRDHLGSYGYSRDASPAIDALAAGGVRFERAYATSGWTAPSVASMLTGLYPSAHGVTGPKTALPEGVRTVAQILRDAGYATAGIVSNKMIGTRNGFGRGFEIFDEQQARGDTYASSRGIAKTATALLERLSAGKRPFFLFVHFFDPHYSYRRHSEYGFAGPGVGRLDGMEGIQMLRSLAADMTEAELGFILDLYDEEIRFTDAGIARILASLRSLGRFEDTLVVVVADHGEEFLERGWIGHTRTLYDELVRVPLILHAPGALDRRVVTQPVSLTSLAPTILELLGVKHSASFQQESLVPLLAGAPTAPSRAVLIEVDFVPVGPLNRAKKTKQQALVAEQFKLIRDEISGKVELFDVVADPGETRDLAQHEPQRVRELTQRLDERLREVTAERFEPLIRELSEQQVRELRALGYAD